MAVNLLFKKVLIFDVLIKINNKFKFSIHNEKHGFCNIVLLVQKFTIHEIYWLKLVQDCSIEEFTFIFEKVYRRNHVAMGFLNQHISEINRELTHEFLIFFISI